MRKLCNPKKTDFFVVAVLIVVLELLLFLFANSYSIHQPAVVGWLCLWLSGLFVWPRLIFFLDVSSCDSRHFSCTNGRCILSEKRCDGNNDCLDNSDEQNCRKCFLIEFVWVLEILESSWVLDPKSDQHQISPCNSKDYKTQWSPNVTQCPWCYNKFLLTTSIGNVQGNKWEFKFSF